MIEVSGNIIIEEGRLLLLYREDEEHWEVPGGKVKEKESPTEAAVREAEEEIEVRVELEKPFYSGEFHHKDQIYLWHGYIAHLNGDPEIKEDRFTDMKWFNSEDLEDVEVAPNLKMIEPSLRRILE